MVIYLEEAVHRKREALGGALTRATLREAVIEGALLRLRPKVMTVSTVVAGLLPIMWSTRVGAEVMKPLATPVLGGMISSLIHVLVVTPVIFLWIHERRLGLRETAPVARPRRVPRPALVAAFGGMLVIAALFVGSRVWTGRVSRGAPAAGIVVQTVRAQGLDIVLLSESGVLTRGRNAFTLEFRSPDGQRVDVGAVHASGNMSMPGMVMSAGLNVRPAGMPGRYAATAEFGMSGAWSMRVEWDGPAGRGSVNFEGTVR